MNFKKLLIAAAALLPALLSAQGQLPAVTAMPATLGKYAPTATEIGEVRATESVPLTARVKGEIVKINFTEGEKVKAGTVLFEIDPREYEAALLSAKADLEKAKSEKDHADLEFKRHEELRESDVDSDAKFQQYKNQKQKADASYLAAEAAVKLAELNLEYTKIKAPFDGWVGFRDCSLHELVGPGTAKQQLATIEKSGGIKVDFNIAETDLITLQRNMTQGKLKVRDFPVKLFLQDGRQIALTGYLKAWDNKISTKTGTLKMQALFDDPDRKLIPGLYVKVQLTLGPATDLIEIPSAAITYDIAGTFVYVLTNVEGSTATVERRYIKIAAEQRKQLDNGKYTTVAFVKEGLKANELFITAGIQKVRNGAKCQFQKGSDE
ncbi:MAG: efflux RND transporter periplasmic adaptor subunit [Lentisphaeria bacterium]|nr:efflux RND transporter periplasmic adaptor subunit [Lentisphaeria bacterium]